MTWLPWLGLGIVVLVIAAVGLTVFGDQRWAGEVKALQAKFEAGRLDSKPGPGLPPTSYAVRELGGLPAPVQRCLRTVLQDGQPVITAATTEMAGSFNMSSTDEQWKPFTSCQRVITRRPGFLWAAKIALLPGLPVRAGDSCIAGRRRSRARWPGCDPRVASSTSSALSPPWL
ncbi:hypothetical protein RA210_U210061 [Rubrivivax sp. A210]|uniref:DUF6920 family protein n=1 Tax=Rubrivivax sp. A210 TaxID=2772301 RepID=UPI00191AF45C|nr:DUF6544 family protein [Rubrivivax sp. A210]CAD5372752.1 hypothetical protein RA210_U210061 [Rubrivivax sp. A210]